MSNNLRTRNGMPFNFVNGLKVRGMDIESLIPGIEGIPEAGSKYQFAGDGTNKSFTLPVSPYNKDAVDVYVKQLYVHPDDYTLAGDTVTLVEAPPAVVAGETYNVVIKVSLTTLNGYVNANRVSFEGENLDDILEKGKPLANYSNLRAYAGAATQIRITDPGIAGFFYYDAADTTSVDNGGTIIVSSDGKRWKRLYDSAVNVRWFGADKTGGIDSTQAFLSSVNSSLEVFVPEGTYLVDGIITLRAGAHIFGSGMSSTKIIAPRSAGASYGVFYTDSGSPFSQLPGIVISDIEFDGLVGTLGFSEFKHLLSLNGVKDTIVERCKFTGFRGDGIYIGTGAGDEDRHNTNVTIRLCVFDGVNKDNRNGISVIDADGISIENNYFIRCSKMNMPGPICIEPNWRTFHVARNINISGNYITDCGGQSGSIGVFMPLAYGVGAVTIPPENIRVTDNQIYSGAASNAIWFRFCNRVTPLLLTESVSAHNIEIARNQISEGNITVLGVKGATIRHNTLQAGIIFVGSNSTISQDNCIEVDVYGNDVRDSPSVYGGISLGNCSRTNVFQNKLINVSVSASRAISLYGDGVTVSLSNIKIFDNHFIGTYAQHIYGSAFSNSSTNTYIFNNTKDAGGNISISASIGYSYPSSSITGTFTPTLIDTSGAITYTQTSSGSYSRVSDLVFCNFNIAVTSITGGPGTALRITGLPFSSNPNTGTTVVPLNFSNIDIPVGYTGVSAIIPVGQAIIFLRAYGDNVSDAALPTTAATSTTTIQGSFVYRL